MADHHDGHQDAEATYETANRTRFDATARHYDGNPDAHKRAAVSGRAMIDTGLFHEGVTTVMDFACGTGLVSRVLAAEDPKSIVGVDISQAMVDRYNQTVSDHGIPPEEMRAVCVPPYERLQGLTFDVIVCASAYHHFPSVDEVTSMLVSTYLNPGGSLLVVDLVRGESSSPEVHKTADHTVPHKGGFTESDMRSTFERAGLRNFSFEVISRAKYHGHPVALFLARGHK